MEILRENNHRFYLVYLILPLVLAAFTHLWNPIGFPSIHPDENTYIFHALEIEAGKGALPRGAPHYDHPYFGRILIASVFGALGYPDSFQPATGSLSSIEMLHIVPRLTMGALAVIDTLLVFKIAERRYNKRVAFVAAILFALMPMSWLLRRVLLDNLFLPFLLCGILFAVSLRKSGHIRQTRTDNRVILVLLSGVFLGLAIFTKIPAFTFIPLVGYLVFSNTQRSFKALGIWLIPVVLIPFLWPLLATSAVQFDSWMAGVAEQAAGRESKPIVDSLYAFFRIDPVLFSAGIIGVLLFSIKKDVLLLLWIFPYIIFFYVISFSDITHLVSILPAFCIAFARLVDESIKYLISKLSKGIIKRILPVAMVSSIAIFGSVSITMLIITNVNTNYFLVYYYTVNYLTAEDDQGDTINDPTLLIGRYWTKSFLWIPQLVFGEEFNFIRDDSKIFSSLSVQEINNSRLILIADNRIREIVALEESTQSDRNASEKFKTLYENTENFKTVEDKTPRYDRDTYPYTSMPFNRGIGDIEIRTNNNGT
jgi:4-amino-4-deoxy-L-arabinose transferase-like glycosyltransferase